MSYAALALEWIGQDTDLAMASVAALGGKALRRPWVAQILGPDPQYGLERYFLRPAKNDYSDSNGVGSRGVVQRFYLGPGLYEIRSFTSWRTEDRYFAILRPGSRALERLDATAVPDWIDQLDYFLEEPGEPGDDAEDLLG